MNELYYITITDENGTINYKKYTRFEGNGNLYKKLSLIFKYLYFKNDYSYSIIKI